MVVTEIVSGMIIAPEVGYLKNVHDFMAASAVDTEYMYIIHRRGVRGRRAGSDERKLGERRIRGT